MITEDFVSFNVAKLLKEKGFNVPVWTRYEDDEDKDVIFGDKYNWNNSPMGQTSAPTLQMVMKWLREVHKLAFIISPQWAEGDMRNPCRWYWEIRGLEDIGLDVYSNPLCNTYEEAVEAACLYSLKNLIKKE